VERAARATKAFGVITPDANLSILFTELPLLQRPAAAARCGFQFVELWWPFGEAVPRQTQLRELADALNEAGVSLVALNFHAGDISAGERGLFSIRGEQQRLKDNIQVAVEFAEPLGCKAFNALYGNRISGVDPAAQDDLATENLAYAATAAERIAGIVLIETQNAGDSPRYPLTRAAEAVDVIERVERASGATNLRFLADLYHLHRAGEDLARTVSAVGRRLGHVQVADDPGRHQPGSGETDFRFALTALRAAGYQGYLGLEYRPLGPSADSFDWLALEPWDACVNWRGAPA
jgi:hydroxypyruvate isomerase